MSRAEWAMLIALSILWGGSFFFVEVAVATLPTLTIVALRVGLAAPVLWAVVALTGRALPRTAHDWGQLAIMGVLNNVLPFTLIVTGQQQIASGLASILNATTPLFAVIFAGLFLMDERFTAPRVLGVALGFLGTVVLIGPGAILNAGNHLGAQLACLGGAVSYALAGVFGRRFRRMGIDPVVVAAAQVTTASLFLIPAAMLIDRPFALPLPDARVVAAVVALAVLSTALAYILYFRILATAGATNILLVTFLIPVSAILLGTLVLGEALAPTQIAGMALIGAGLLAIDGRVWRRLQHS